MTQTNRFRAPATLFALMVTVLLGLFALAGSAHAATFTVTNTNNSGTGSLRQAITDSNNAAGADTINFNIPTTDSGYHSATGVFTISPFDELPTITDPVTIDGYTQPGSGPNKLEFGTDAKPLVELDGSQAGNAANGLRIYGAGGGTVIRGLVINRFGGTGIFSTGSGVRIEGNFIGTDPTGTTDQGNGAQGVLLGAKNGVVGGDMAGSANFEARNVISGNGGTGVFLGEAASGNKVEGNLIGTGKNGTSDLGNSSSGVHIEGGSNNTVGGEHRAAGNTIAYNGLDGVAVAFGAGHRILFNSIFSNDGLGIDLAENGVSANDGKDSDTGPNHLQNYPVVTFAGTDSFGDTKFSVRLNSRSRKYFTIQLFWSPDRDPSGHGEGQVSLGQRTIKTNRKGRASFTFSMAPLGGVVAATATNKATGDTSEFSWAVGP
jgi:hypothetical protein